ncbi:MAG: hypothetical protein HXY41_02615 [Chloroflexi bacterium]|nr:hypothetical protein [Chloroflexota bacterium]
MRHPRHLLRRLMLLAAVLLAACAPAAPEAVVLPTLFPSQTPSPEIQAAVEGTLTALVPTVTPRPETATPSPMPTATPIVVTLPALAGQRIPPPLDISLPDGWQTVGYDVLILSDVIALDDVGTIRGVPLAVYRGPVTNGQGTIVLLWGFPNVVNPFPEGGTPGAPDLWADGLRLLRLAVLEQDCNIGTDERRTYRVGLLSAVGAQFSAVACPELPDTRGWFVGVQEGGLNFVFYAYVEGPALVDPQRLDAFNAASREIQAILDTVRFNLPEATPDVP